jgi:hypothetical protein
VKTKNLTEWRKLVLEKDNYTCQICRQAYPAKQLVAHHVRQRQILNPIEAKRIW